MRVGRELTSVSFYGVIIVPPSNNPFHNLVLKAVGLPYDQAVDNQFLYATRSGKVKNVWKNWMAT